MAPLSLLLLLAIWTFCPSSTAVSWNREPSSQNLVVFLIDGYSASLLNRTDAHLRQGFQTLAKNGVQAAAMRSVFPTQSYPVWFSLSTGLFVENHNFTSNYMYDEEDGLLFQRDQGVNDSDSRWWTNGPSPFWYDAGKARIDVHCLWFATCHRPHVDMIVQVPYDRRHSFKQEEETGQDLFGQLPKVMKHVRKYQMYRQQLVLVRFGGVARALKKFGEGSDQALQAISKADAHVRRIQEEIEKHELIETTNLIVLSDYGLLRIEPEARFYIEECLADYTRIKQIVNSLSFALVYPAKGHEDTVFFELKVCDQWAQTNDYDNEAELLPPPVNIYRRNELPDEWHWKNGRFMAPIVIVAKPGVILATRKLPSTDVSEALGRQVKMVDGWSNDHPETQAIFMARGPAFKVDYQSGPIELVDVYQLVLNILSVAPSHMHNGTWSHVKDMLTDGWEDRATSHGARFDVAPILLLISLLVPLALVFPRRT